MDVLSENTFNYTRNIKEHSINLLAGFTAQKTKVTDEQVIALNFPSDNIQTANTALQIEAPFIDANGNLQGTYTLKNHEGLLSYPGNTYTRNCAKWIVCCI